MLRSIANPAVSQAETLPGMRHELTRIERETGA